jgi:hypothetical protein
MRKWKGFYHGSAILFYLIFCSRMRSLLVSCSSPSSTFTIFVFFAAAALVVPIWLSILLICHRKLSFIHSLYDTFIYLLIFPQVSLPNHEFGFS